MTIDLTRKWFAHLIRPYSWPRLVRVAAIILFPIAIPVLLALICATILSHLMLSVLDALRKFLTTPRKQLSRHSMYSHHR